jgi:outer membrane protein OmpA-like peptidoglycan-associated protein
MVLVGVAIPAWVACAGAQTVKTGLFGEADRALARADSARAAILAPKSYSRAMKHYERAEENFTRGRNLDQIRRELAESVRDLNAAIEACELAKLTFATSLRARSDALKAEAPRYADQAWLRASAKFEEGARTLEDGDVNDARRKGSEAEALFREAELKSIKTNYLDETRQLISTAKTQRVNRLAPKTLQRAEQLLAQAETELARDRYDTDRPRNLAREAKYEARHALHLAKAIQQAKDNKSTMEDLLLEAEKPITQIAATVDVVPDFSQGPAATTTAIVDRVETIETAWLQTRQDLAESQQRITDLETELGGVASEREEIQRRAEAHERARQQFLAVERMFDRGEARLLREGDDITIRLTGLGFAPGKSEIRPEEFALLTKVEGAILAFPVASVEVHGHTDSYGSDAENQTLSEQRAEAVRRYLLANMNNVQMKAVGFGESRPIANNETVEGRARNRRIEIVIHPSSLAYR